MKTTNGLRALVVAAVVLSGASIALGVGITPIGVLTPTEGGTVDSRVYAISPDGTYAVGSSNGQNVAGTATMSQAVIWSAASNLVQLPNAPAAPMVDMATSARGVVVKANGEIGVAAYYSNYPTTGDYRMHHYTAPAADLAGGTYVSSAGALNQTIGTYNAARNYDNGLGNTLSNDWSISGQRGNSLRGVQSYSWGFFSDSGVLTDHQRIYNVSSRVPVGSSRGYAAGYQQNLFTRLRHAMFGVTGSTQTLLPGDAGYQSEVLGMSPYTTSTAKSGVMVGYDQDTTDNHYQHAFYYTQGAAAMTLLAEPADAVGSQAIDVRQLSIGGPKEAIIGGFATFEGGWEQAVIWDKTGTWVGYYSDRAWSVRELLILAGQDVSGWKSLSRVTSMSDDGRTIGGWGVWAEDNSIRGFVATIPEPASLLLLSLGGLALLRRNRR